MKTTAAHSTLHIREQLIRHPESIEAGLNIVDSELTVLDEPPLDLIGLDANGVLCLIVVRDEPEGERRREDGGNVIEDAVFYWHWVTDFRDDYISGVGKLAGRDAVMAPPRVMILAPSFSQKLIDLASYVTTRVEVELYEIDPDDVAAGAKRVALPKLSATPAARKKYDAYHGKKMEELVAENKEYFDNPKTHPYQPLTGSELAGTVESSLRPSFDELAEKIGGIEGLRGHVRPNRLSFVNAAGLKVAELVIGPGGGFTANVYEFDSAAPSETSQKGQFRPEESAEAVAAIEEALKSFPSP